ncbi:MAG TPA: hypothetical protein VK712_01060 [Verrucomicrobiae bacterium]|nr:hypothetical protein [Verrucomicrobiae bacterium]
MNTMPSEVMVNPDEKTVIMTPPLSREFPDAPKAFRRVDEVFAENPQDHLKMLEESVFSFTPKSGSQAEVTCSLIHGQEVGDELLVVYAPFADGAPNSRSEEIWRYMQADQAVVQITKGHAAPNSWNQISKSWVMSELLQAVDQDMPVLTIFSPIPTHAYSRGDRKRFRHGDFTPAADITAQAIQLAQERLHGAHSETQIDTLHLHGASLGASNAIGAAAGLLEAFAVRSLTAQELIIGPTSYFPDLATKFTIKNTVGEPSSEVITQMIDYARIGEPAIRRMIDRDGTELATAGRAIISMLKYSYLKGLTDPEHNQTPRDVARVAEAGAHLAIVLAANSGLTQETNEYLPPAGRESVVHVRAENGHRVAHLIDEHVAPTALLAVMNIARSR